jgi:hypothetical protein
MKLTEVIDLIHAGYTKDEISAMLTAEQEAGTPDKKEKEKEPEQNQKEPEKTQPEPKTEPKTEPKQEQKEQKAEPVPEYMQQLAESIAQLKKAVELQNLTAGRQPEKKRTVDDILREAMKEE